MPLPSLPSPTSGSWKIRLAPLLLILVIGMIVSTLSLLAIFCYHHGKNIIQHFIQRDLIQASQSVTSRMHQRFEQTEYLLREWEQLCNHQIVSFSNEDRMTRYMAEQLRQAPHVAWLYYGQHPGGEFIGVRHGESQNIILNKSTPDPKSGAQKEWALPLHGNPVPLTVTNAAPFDPRERPWYVAAMKRQGYFWTDPYLFHEGPMGITISKAHRHPATGAVQGVFAADFHLKDFEKFLAEIHVSPRGGTFLINSDGDILARPAEKTSLFPNELILAAIQKFGTRIGEMHQHSEPEWTDFTWNSEVYEAVIDAFEVPGEKHWLTLIILPRSDTIGYVFDQLKGMIFIGLGVVFVSIFTGNLLARKLASPIDQISRDLAEVGRFNITDQISPSSHIHELSVVSDSVDRMKKSLRSFGRYVPVDLVHRLLECGQEAVLGGDIRRVTILFTDLAGFTQFSENQPPEKIVPHLAIHLKAITEAVNAHHGSVDKYLGDGVLALFNAPETDAKHVVHACEAALDALRRLPPHRKGDSQPYSRIGLHTGEALVGNIGTPDRFDFTAIGDTVNLASRMEGLNKLYGTRALATSEVMQESGDSFLWRNLDRVAVKGRSSETNIHELITHRNIATKEILEATAEYETGLDLYLRQKFVEAIPHFKSAQRLRPEDDAATLFLVRIGEFIKTPPPPDWNGVFVATTK
jgi:adenylate cyclase